MIGVILTGLLLSLLLPAATALADAGDPVDANTTGTFVTNPDGTHTLTLQGTWQWPRNCGERQVGWEVDWNDPSQPGNVVATKNNVTTDVGAATGNTRNPADNTVDIAGPGNCVPGSPTTGFWGPISHTYAADVTTAKACVVIYDVKIPPSSSGDHSLIAGGSSRNKDNSVEKNYVSAESGCFPQTFTVENPQVNLEKTGPATADRGGTITYNFKASVPTGGEPLHDVVLSDPKCDPGTLTPPTKTGGDQDDIMEVGELWEYSCTHVVTQSDPQQLVNVATVTGKSPANTSVSDDDDHVVEIVDPLEPMIYLAKRGPESAHRGDTITYGFDVKIPSEPSQPARPPLHDVVVTDAKCDAPPVRLPDNPGDNDNELEPNEKWFYSCTHVVTNNDPDPLHNEATVVGTDPNNTQVSDWDYWDVDLIDDEPNPISSIELEKSGPATASRGETITYHFTVTNPITGTRLSNVWVDDPLCGPGTWTANKPGSEDGFMEPGDVWTYSCKRTVTPSDPDPMPNTATVTAKNPSNQSVGDSDDHIVDLNDQPTGGPDLSITKTDSADPIAAGGHLFYTITVTNNGAQTATGVTVTDTIQHSSWRLWSPPVASQGSCSPTDADTGDVIVCSLGSLTAGQTVTITLEVKPRLCMTMINTAIVSGDDQDPTPSNNSATESTLIEGMCDDDPDMSVVTKVKQKRGVIGKRLTYRLTINQGGPEHGTGITVTDRLDPTVMFIKAIPTLGACEHENGKIECLLGEMSPGDKAYITIVVMPTRAGKISNRAEVDVNEYDAVQENNTFVRKTRIVAPRGGRSFV
jgi:uncharacterized repeat protein (TIGR01451 family)